MELIALSGFARVGKDEAAKVLVNRFGFKQVAFADKLREVLYALNPIVEANYEYRGMVPLTEYTGPAYMTLQEAIDTWGWDGYKESPFSSEIRRLLQRLGTEAGRQTLWDTIWIDAAFANLNPDSKVVVSDARFINEFEAVKSRGGQVWRIERPGVGPVSDHPSETEAPTYEHFDARLDNDGSLDDWYETVAETYLLELE